MFGTPSYLSGLGEREPHYFEPTTPLALQPFVSDTPLDRGDGVRPVMLPAQPQSPVYRIASQKKGKEMRAQRHFGAAPCVPCMAMNPRPLAGYGNDANGQKPGWQIALDLWRSKSTSGEVNSSKPVWQQILQSLSPEEKAQIQGGVVGTVSLKACEKFGLLCPPPNEEPSSSGYEAPVALYVGMGVLGLALVGTIVYVATRG